MGRLVDSRLKNAITGFMNKRAHTEKAVTFERIPADGSTRMFWRIMPPGQDPSVVVMYNPPQDASVDRENRAYLKIGVHLKGKGLPVPEIYEFDLNMGWFIVEDLGTRNLQDVIASGTDPLAVYETVLDELVRLQIQGAEGFDPSWCCQTRHYDPTVMRRYESHYFRDAFLHHYLGLKAQWPELEDTFEHIAHGACKGAGGFFLHRDFQSKNILLPSQKVGIVDWQGGRLGPLGYDLASLLIDPYTGLAPRQQDTLYHGYIRRIAGINADWAASLHTAYPYLAIQRNLQILGAFSYLTKVKHKTCFEAYIPGALTGLGHLLDRVDDTALFPLKDLIAAITERCGYSDAQPSPKGSAGPGKHPEP